MVIMPTRARPLKFVKATHSTIEVRYFPYVIQVFLITHHVFVSTIIIIIIYLFINGLLFSTIILCKRLDPYIPRNK